VTQLIFLGGFLGSGKTTTFLRLAHDFVRRGKRVGILTNDQGQDLVDTQLFRVSGYDTQDVRGGCFCCRLDDFIREAEALTAKLKPDFLFAEPVGSCTDLVATVVRPLRRLRPNDFDIGPFTVVVDPIRVGNVLSPQGKATLSEKVTYIYKLQQMEASAIAVNKIDLLSSEELSQITDLLQSQFPRQHILRYSARTGQAFDDIANWLLGRNSEAVPESPEIDYDLYAAGEAELAWFDASLQICAPHPIDMDEALMKLGSLIERRMSVVQLEIAHVKLFLRAGERACSLSILGGGARPELFRRAGTSAVSFQLLVNARVATRPDTLKGIMEHCLQLWVDMLDASASRPSVASFSPPRPVPAYRMS
jgi:Ni2+-binding GTPase involved in maturation of urease and hydrogenase